MLTPRTFSFLLCGFWISRTDFLLLCKAPSLKHTARAHVNVALPLWQRPWHGAGCQPCSAVPRGQCCQGNVALRRDAAPRDVPGRAAREVPASPQHPEGLQLASFALFSTSLSPNRDKNRTNMLESPPKLLFWFQDDAIWVPVSNLQMQAGGGERKAPEPWLQSKAPAQKRSCPTLPGAKSHWPGRCQPGAELPTLLHPWQGSDFPGMGSQSSPQLLLAAAGSSGEQQ